MHQLRYSSSHFHLSLERSNRDTSRCAACVCCLSLSLTPDNSDSFKLGQVHFRYWGNSALEMFPEKCGKFMLEMMLARESTSIFSIVFRNWRTLPGHS